MNKWLEMCFFNKINFFLMFSFSYISKMYKYKFKKTCYYVSKYIYCIHIL